MINRIIGKLVESDNALVDRKRVNIREALNKIDCEHYTDFLNLYECANLSLDKKKALAQELVKEDVNLKVIESFFDEDGYADAMEDRIGQEADKTIYNKLKEILPPEHIDNHETDLYVVVCPESTRLLKDYEYKVNVTRFEDEDGIEWYDIPFAYDPAWEDKLTESKTLVENNGYCIDNVGIDVESKGSGNGYRGIVYGTENGEEVEDDFNFTYNRDTKEIQITGLSDLFTESDIATIKELLLDNIETNDLFTESVLPRNAKRITATPRDGGASVSLTKKDGVWSDGKQGYDNKFLRNFYDIKVNEVDKDYKPKRTKQVAVLQGNYGYGWDDLIEYEMGNPEIRQDLKSYRENEPGVAHRVIYRRIPVDTQE